MKTTDWFVFQPFNDEASIHPNYRAAVWEAQCNGCTECRPKRHYAGSYEVLGCSGRKYMIVSQPVMAREWPELMLQAYTDRQQEGE